MFIEGGFGFLIGLYEEVGQGIVSAMSFVRSVISWCMLTAVIRYVDAVFCWLVVLVSLVYQFLTIYAVGCQILSAPTWLSFNTKVFYFIFVYIVDWDDCRQVLSLKFWMFKAFVASGVESDR